MRHGNKLARGRLHREIGRRQNSSAVVSFSVFFFVLSKNSSSNLPLIDNDSVLTFFLFLYPLGCKMAGLFSRSWCWIDISDDTSRELNIARPKLTPDSRNHYSCRGTTSPLPHTFRSRLPKLVDAEVEIGYAQLSVPISRTGDTDT